MAILVAMSPRFEPPGDSQDTYAESFDAWLKRQPESEQAALLGRTCAALWRTGKIETRGLAPVRSLRPYR